MSFQIIDPIIKQALEEDKADRDITSELLFPKDRWVKAEIVAKGEGVVAGLAIAERVFYLLDNRIKFKKIISDGNQIREEERIASLEGSLKKILAGERTALNFLMRLSGIATLTKKIVEKVYPYKVKIMDTRKTTPGLRILEKYAVRVGGGFNHRMDLSDGVLIKDNHLRLQTTGYRGKDFKELISRIKQGVPEGMEVEIEVKNLREFKTALETQPDVIMLDNMSLSEIRKAVKIRNQFSNFETPQLEVSGGVELKNVRKIASTGVERISIGQLTHSFSSLDFSLEIF